MHRVFTGRVILLLLLLVTLDQTFGPVLSIGSCTPVLAYLLILYAAFEWGWQRAVPMAFFVGLVRDATSGHVIGLEASVLVGFALLLELAVQKMGRELLAIRMVVGFLYVVLSLIGIGLVGIFLSGSGGVQSGYVGASVLSALYTTVLLPVFFFLARKWFGEEHLLKQYELFK